MTNTERFQVNVYPEEPENPKEGTIYLRYYAVSNTFEIMLYINGVWI